MAFLAIALFSVIDLVASTAAMCEWRTYQNGQYQRGEDWFRWNVEPNQNENAFFFRRLLFARLLRFNEALVFQRADGSLYLADSFSREEFAFKPNKNNWKIRFLTSGTLTFTKLNGWNGQLDVFLVGGGGNGETIRGARGGGGGYTKTVKGISIAIATPYTVTIGASSGTSSAFGASANGASGANGGSGGGGGGSSSGTPGNGGSNGGNGTAGNVSQGGAGQGRTTREFGESTGKLYSGGGGGSAAGAGAAGDSTAGAGANFGGAAKNGVANTGGGGGAAYSGTAGRGGSGIVIARNARRAA